MGWLANLKIKRADKLARQEFDYQHQQWNRDVALLDKLLTVFSAAQKGESSVANIAVEKSGEIELWSGTGIFHQTGRSPSQYVGGSSGVSIPVVAGIRFRVGAMRGTIVPGDEYQMDKDSGQVLLTNQRILFSGHTHSSEWLFSKLIGASTSSDESDFVFNVSNRQRASGIRFDPETGHEFNRFFALASSSASEGIDAVVNELRQIEKRIAGEEPKLVLPSLAPAAIEPPKTIDKGL